MDLAEKQVIVLFIGHSEKVYDDLSKCSRPSTKNNGINSRCKHQDSLVLLLVGFLRVSCHQSGKPRVLWFQVRNRMATPMMATIAPSMPRPLVLSL